MHGQTIHPVSNVGAGGGNRTPDPLITNINPAPPAAPDRSLFITGIDVERTELRSNTARQCKPQCKPARQIDRVLAALNAGCRTSPEVSLETGLSVKHCSAWLRELVRLGAAEHTGFLPAHDRGRKAHFYEPRMFHVDTRGVRDYR